MSKKKKKQTAQSMKWQEWMVWAYLMIMLGVFPLYFRNGYFDMGDSKYLFFRTVTLGVLAALIAVWPLNILAGEKKGWVKPELTVTDWAALAYGAAAVVSWCLSPFRSDAWIGSVGWHMGLLSQLLFVAIYFVVSRFGTEQKEPLWAMGIGGGLTFLVAYLHRFDIDPLGLYAEVQDYAKISFLGTIGNANWYSSFICVVLPVMMGVYMTARWKRTGIGLCQHILSGGFIFLGFCGAVTQSSDSVYAGLGLAFLFLFWFALDNRDAWKRFLEIGMIASGALKITGIFQVLFPERVLSYGALSFALTKGNFTWLVLTFLAIVYVVTCQAEKKMSQAQMERFKTLIHWFRIVFYGLLALGTVALLMLMWLASTGRIILNSGIWQQTGYLVFDEQWGSRRGWIWMYGARVFSEYPLSMKLFGCGPDSLSFYTAVHHAEEVRNMWGSSVLTNVHNEWLTALVNYGIIGGGAYISIFAAALVRILKNERNRPVLIAAGVSIVAYVGHNFFCFQQAVCTPLIFIVIGTGEYLIRKGGSQKRF